MPLARTPLILDDQLSRHLRWRRSFPVELDSIFTSNDRIVDRFPVTMRRKIHVSRAKGQALKYSHDLHSVDAVAKPRSELVKGYCQRWVDAAISWNKWPYLSPELHMRSMIGEQDEWLGCSRFTGEILHIISRKHRNLSLVGIDIPSLYTQRRSMTHQGIRRPNDILEIVGNSDNLVRAFGTDPEPIALLSSRRKVSALDISIRDSRILCLPCGKSCPKTSRPFAQPWLSPKRQRCLRR